MLTTSSCMPKRGSQRSHDGCYKYCYRFSPYYPSYTSAVEHDALDAKVSDALSVLSEISTAIASLRHGCCRKIQLILLFSIGMFVVAVTIARVPLIFKGSVAQDIRTLVGLDKRMCEIHND